ILGKSGHAAFPQDANDTVVAAASLIMQVQTIISRSIDPIQSGVITLGKIEAGTIRNVIAGQARIEGTIRGLTQNMILTIDQRLKEICLGIEKSFGVEVKLDLNQGGYWPVENNPQLTKNFISYMKSQPTVNSITTEPKMTGEDFGFLLAKFPGTMLDLILTIDQRLKEICLGIEKSFGVEVKLDLNQGGYWPVENNPQLTKNFISYMKSQPTVNFITTEPKMTGEDFGFLLAKFPGTMFWLGVGDPDSQLHTATLNPDEKSIQRGVDAIKGFLINRMRQ